MYDAYDRFTWSEGFSDNGGAGLYGIWSKEAIFLNVSLSHKSLQFSKTKFCL